MYKKLLQILSLTILFWLSWLPIDTSLSQAEAMLFEAMRESARTAARTIRQLRPEMPSFAPFVQRQAPRMPRPTGKSLDTSQVYLDHSLPQTRSGAGRKARSLMYSLIGATAATSMVIGYVNSDPIAAPLAPLSLSPEQKELKVKTWNVWTEKVTFGLSKEMGTGTEGFYYRLPSIIEYLKKSDADIMNLQEWLNEEDAIDALQKAFCDEYKIVITPEGTPEGKQLCVLCTLVKKNLFTEEDAFSTFAYTEKDEKEVKVDTILGSYISSLELLVINVHCRTLTEVRRYLAEHGVKSATRDFSSKIKEQFGSEVKIKIVMSGDFNAFNQGAYARNLYLEGLKNSLGKGSAIPSENALSTLTGATATSTFFPSPCDYLSRDIFEAAKKLGLKVDILRKIILPKLITYKSNQTLTENNIKSIGSLKELCQGNEANGYFPEYLEDLFRNFNLEELEKDIYSFSKENKVISSIKILKGYLENNGVEREGIETLFSWIQLLRALWETDNVMKRGKNIDLIIISDGIKPLQSIVDSKGISIPVEKYLKNSEGREDYEENMDRFTLLYALFDEKEIEPVVNLSDHYPVELIFQVKQNRGLKLCGKKVHPLDCERI